MLGVSGFVDVRVSGFWFGDVGVFGGIGAVLTFSVEEWDRIRTSMDK